MVSNPNDKNHFFTPLFFQRPTQLTVTEPEAPEVQRIRRPIGPHVYVGALVPADGADHPDVPAVLLTVELTLPSPRRGELSGHVNALETLVQTVEDQFVGTLVFWRAGEEEEGNVFEKAERKS